MDDRSCTSKDSPNWLQHEKEESLCLARLLKLSCHCQNVKLICDMLQQEAHSGLQLIANKVIGTGCKLNKNNS
ncbi:hypothetical protein AAC387_Pa02g4514 [Persea americana]